jgi:hypothetical protein
MDKRFFIETNTMQKNDNNINNSYSFFPTNDNVVNEFLNKTISLENLIENEIYNTKV